MAVSESILAEEAVEPAVRPEGVAVRLDVLVWLGLIAAGAALRLARLDALPLTFDESARAFDALRVSHNAVPDGWRGDLAGALTSYLFRALGETDLVARLVPAVAGALMVGAVALCGRGLGRSGALAAGALLAFSPLAVLLARSGTAFSLGGLLAVAMAGSLLSYIREPRALTAFVFAVAFGLAPSTDAVATTAALACVGFLLLEPVVAGGGQVARAWVVFRRSPSHWLSVALVLAAALELALTHFGTSVERTGLPGLRQWGDMFALPRDGREPEYQVALLLAYEWPVLLAGGLAAAFFVWRMARGGARALTPGQRLGLVWTALAAFAVAAATQREAGQLLMLVVPLAVLGGLLAEELAPALDWAVLRRWWPVAVAALALVAYAALITTGWSQGRTSDWDRVSLVMALGGAALLLAVSYSLLERRATVIAVAAVAALAFAFLAHTDLNLARNDGGVEMAVDTPTSQRIDQFQQAVERIAAERAGPVFVDPGLRQPLAWYLRDLPVAAGPVEEDAALVVVTAGTEIEGFTPVGETWRLGEGWYPLGIRLLPLWRWLVYREPYGKLDGVDAQILVAEP
jgi:hypothetical protein